MSRGRGAVSHEPAPNDIIFIHSGCTLLDCVLGGGWPLGRVSNVVGDKSTGKTLLAIEASANFRKQFPEGRIWYHETEAAFDRDYAAILGMPVNTVEFVEDKNTVEELIENLQAIAATEDEVGLYIVDSLDAISDKAEMARAADKGSYGAEKPKKMGELFRKITKAISLSKIHLMIISQVRDKIGVMFGEKHTRSGGRALDYYASQILWLSETGKLKKTINKLERITGVEVLANCKKNKISVPFRKCEFPIVFGYGIDDETACREWIKSATGKELDKDAKVDKEKVKKLWLDIEEKFAPKESKYGKII